MTGISHESEQAAAYVTPVVLPRTTEIDDARNVSGILERRIAILGTRGIPASHGGFETFAERLALYLVERGWQVEVYGQDDTGSAQDDTWRGIVLRRVAAPFGGSLGSVIFDLKSVLRVCRGPKMVLTLGYNTAIFSIILRCARRINLINMDGLEWQRAKWPALIRGWFWLNERFGCWLGNHLIADHPAIADHLATRVRRSKITCIPYGADAVVTADPSPLKTWGLIPGEYLLVIARAEPENSLLEIVSAFSSRKRGRHLVCLGAYDPARNKYHRAVMEAASDEVIFPGSIFEHTIVNALRLHCRVYIHGHQVGGTNPSLVEALGAGCAILARDNVFNRWVAGSGARFFADAASCATTIDELLAAGDSELATMRQMSRSRHAQEFLWDTILKQYETLLDAWRRPAAVTTNH